MTCREEGCRYPAIRGGRCYQHAEIHADSRRAIANDREHRGRCIQCAHPWAGPTKTCRPCLDRRARANRLAYWQLRQIGVCVICKTAPASTMACAPCAAEKARQRSPKARARKNKRNVQRQQELRAAKPPGQCSKPRCANDAPGRFKLCPQCRAERNARDLAKRSAGLCSCGRERAPGRSRCADCIIVRRRSDRKNKRKRQRADRRRRDQRRAEGKCRTRHCPNPPAPNRKGCQECLDDEANEKAQRRAQGLCFNCGKRPPLPDRSRCHVCLERQRRSQQKIRARARRLRQGD